MLKTYLPFQIWEFSVNVIINILRSRVVIVISTTNL